MNEDFIYLATLERAMAHAREREAAAIDLLRDEARDRYFTDPTFHARVRLAEKAALAANPAVGEWLNPEAVRSMVAFVLAADDRQRSQQ